MPDVAVFTAPPTSGNAGILKFWIVSISSVTGANNNSIVLAMAIVAGFMYSKKSSHSSFAPETISSQRLATKAAAAPTPINAAATPNTGKLIAANAAAMPPNINSNGPPIAANAATPKTIFFISGERPFNFSATVPNVDWIFTAIGSSNFPNDSVICLLASSLRRATFA